MKPVGPATPIYGLIAEFRSPTEIVEAARKTFEAGYRDTDAFTPFPIEALSEAMGWHTRGRLPKIVLAGGCVGAIAGYMLQYYAAAIAYPVNVGGKPFHSWVSFVPVTFECAVLVAALSAVLGMLALNGLPRPYHPVFNSPNFALATSDRFFLCIEASDPLFDREKTRAFLSSLAPAQVSDVDH